MWGDDGQQRRQNQGLVKTPMSLEPVTAVPHVQRFRGKWYSADLKKDNITDYLGSLCTDKGPQLRMGGGWE